MRLWVTWTFVLEDFSTNAASSARSAPRQFEGFSDLGVALPVTTPSISYRLFAIASLRENERWPPIPNVIVRPMTPR